MRGIFLKMDGKYQANIHLENSLSVKYLIFPINPVKGKVTGTEQRKH